MASGLPIGLQLVELGLITREQLDVALNLQRKKKERLGELLVALKFISEIDILKVLADRFQVSYLSAEKLSTLDINREMLDYLPVEFCEQNYLLPLSYNELTGTLSVLTVAPSDQKLLREITSIAKVKDIQSVLSIKSSIRAGIELFYHSNKNAFDHLTSSMISSNSMMGMTPGSSKPDMVTKPKVEAAKAGTRMADEILSLSLLSDNVYIETLNLLVSIIEMRRGSFRGHSASLARHVKKVADKLGLMPQETYFCLIASYLHDLGTGEDRHYTLLNINSNEDRRIAQRLAQAPLRLIESVNFPAIIPAILRHVYERWDGKGFPDGLAGEKIPLGSRIIAVVEAYEDLMRDKSWSGKGQREIWQELARHQGTAFDRRIVKALFESLQTKSETNGTEHPIGTGSTVLIIDYAGETFAPIMGKLKEIGFRVMLARDTDAAINSLKHNNVDLILSEIETRPVGGFKLCRSIKENSSFGDVIFVFISPNDENSDLIQEAFDAGADDFFAYPLKPELIVTKLKRLMMARHKRKSSAEMEAASASSSVSGSLSQLGIPDVLQLLTGSRKKGILNLRSGHKEGRIYITDGLVINADLGGVQGIPAFNQLIRWESGDFWFDGGGELPEQNINIPVQNLILESFRIWDEEKAGRG